MGFEASHAALRFGYASVKDWLGRAAAGALWQRFGAGPVPHAARRFFPRRA